jgi:hypothetical protein
MSAVKDPVFAALVGDESGLPPAYLVDDYLQAATSRKVEGIVWRMLSCHANGRHSPRWPLHRSTG